MPARDPADDAAYFAKRAQEERERAATCEDNVTALAHLKMADEYNQRLRDLSAGHATASE